MRGKARIQGERFQFALDEVSPVELTMKDLVSVERIVKGIYLIRDKKVMMDRGLADLYGVKTKALKQAVRRNIRRFSEDFMFKMSRQGFEDWRSQFVTSKVDRMGLGYRPMAFTEQGVAVTDPSFVTQWKMSRVWKSLLNREGQRKKKTEGGK